MTQPLPPLPQTPKPVPKYARQPTAGEAITSLLTNNTYTVGEKIGEGAFGIVYACTDVWNNDLAVKVLKPIASYDKVKEAAVEEFQKLVTLRHPFLTFVHDAFEYRDTFYIVTERCYCPLTTLFTVVKDFNGFSWIRPIARCLLQAVQYLHTAGFVHQDIHLGNVFTNFTKDETDAGDPGSINFKLGDLGVAKAIAEVSVQNTRAQWILPPEVLNPTDFGPLDNRLDIYHVGLLFLQLTQGKVLEFTKDEVLAGKPRALALTLPAPYAAALEKALRRHVQFRTATAMELWRDLNSPPPTASPAPSAPSPQSGAV